MPHPDISDTLPKPTEPPQIFPSNVTFDQASEAANYLINFTNPQSSDTNDLGKKCDHPGCKHIEYGEYRNNAIIGHSVSAHPSAHEEQIKNIAKKLKGGKKSGKKMGGTRRCRRSKKRRVRNTRRKKRVRSSRRSKSSHRSRNPRR